MGATGLAWPASAWISSTPRGARLAGASKIEGDGGEGGKDDRGGGGDRGKRKRKKRPASGITKPKRISPELREFVGGAEELPRTEAIKMVWAHITVNNLQVLLGDVGAGKSSLVLRFVKGQFVEFQESTIGAAFFSQTLAVNDETVKFEIWDTAGQERYHSLAPMYYRGAAAAIVVYDITNPASFTRAKKWVQELLAQGNPNIIVALAGNKADMLDSRQVPAEEAKTCAGEWALLHGDIC